MYFYTLIIYYVPLLLLQFYQLNQHHILLIVKCHHKLTLLINTFVLIIPVVTYHLNLLTKHLHLQSVNHIRIRSSIRYKSHNGSCIYVSRRRVWVMKNSTDNQQTPRVLRFINNFWRLISHHDNAGFLVPEEMDHQIGELYFNFNFLTYTSLELKIPLEKKNKRMKRVRHS